MLRDESGSRSQQKKYLHNEAEKKRIRTINKSVDDIRVILDVVLFNCLLNIGGENFA